MRNIEPGTFACAFTVVALVSIVSAQGTQPAHLPASAPVPPQIAAARKVFISNGGESLPDLQVPLWSGGPDRPYNQFYEAMKGWGRYEVVSSPADADLVLKIVLVEEHLKLRLVVLDPKTRVTLWTISEYVVGGALRMANRDKNFDQAMNTLVGRLKLLANAAPPGVTPSN